MSKKLAAQRDVQRVVGSSSGSSWQIMLHIYLYTFLEPLLKLSMLFQVLGLWLLINLKEYSLSLGLAVTED